MKTIHTVCPRDCYSTCSLEASVDDQGKLVKLKGAGDHPVTQGFTCMRAPRDPERVYQNRVLYPQVRTGPKPGRAFERISWDDALDRVSNKISSIIDRWGPEKLLAINYAGNMGLLAEQFPQRLWKALGASETDHSICSKSGHAGLKLHYGLSYGLQPEQLLNGKAIVFWGINPVVCAPHLWALAIRARQKKGAMIIVIDPRRSETAEKADLWVAPRPGTDVALAHGVACRLIQQDRIDAQFIQKWTHGFDAYRQQVQAWTPARTADTTGVDPAAIQDLSDQYGTRRPGAIVMGIGFQKSIQGAEAVRAVSLLPALTGTHRGFFYTNGAGSFVNTPYISGQSRATPPSRVVSQVALGQAMLDGRFKLIYVWGTNPALTLPDQSALREGIVKNDVFVVVHDPHWNETAAYSDVVLPATSYLEKEDIVLPWSHFHVRKSNRVIEPLGESRDETGVMIDLAGRLNVGLNMIHESPWSALETAFADALARGDFKRLLQGEPVSLKCRPLDEYQTPSKKIELISGVAARKGFSPFPTAAVVSLEPGWYTLLNSAVREYTHTQFQEVFGPIPPAVWINPMDAAGAGLKAGSRINLTNDRGTVRARAKITDRVPVGVLWSPRQFSDENGVPFNVLCSGSPQKLGGGSVFNSTVVRIETMPEKERPESESE